MSFQTYPISILIVLVFITKTQGCQQKNISCDDIKTDYGFKLSYQCPEGSEISVREDKTTVAYRGPGNETFECSPEVLSIDNRSVMTRSCQNLQVQCIAPNGENRVKESCMDYKITGNSSFGNIMDVAQQRSWDKFECNTIKENLKKPIDPPWKLIIGVSLACLVLIGISVIIGMLYCCYTRWKKKQHGAATVYLWTGCCLRKENSQAERGEEQETSVAESNSVQEVTAGNLETQQNGVMRTSEMSASDPRGSGENDIEQDGTLGNVLVHSIDPNADGTTPQSFSLDHNFSNGGIQLTENGAPDVNRASNRRAMNRSLRGDPGGVHYNKEKDGVKIIKESSGWTLGDGGREDHGSEGQPLLSNQGAASQDFDMTGESVASDQVSRCSTAPDADVESTHKINNYDIHKY